MGADTHPSRRCLVVALTTAIARSAKVSNGSIEAGCLCVIPGDSRPFSHWIAAWTQATELRSFLPSRRVTEGRPGPALRLASPWVVEVHHTTTDFPEGSVGRGPMGRERLHLILSSPQCFRHPSPASLFLSELCLQPLLSLHSLGRTPLPALVSASDIGKARGLYNLV